MSPASSRALSCSSFWAANSSSTTKSISAAGTAERGATNMSQLITLIQAAIRYGTVILFGATGEILTEKSGNLNLGVPGIMYLGGIAGLVSAFFYETGVANPTPFMAVLVSLVCAFVAAALGGLIF